MLFVYCSSYHNVLMLIREIGDLFTEKCVFSNIAIVICENAIIIYSAVRRDEQHNTKLTRFSVKRFAISLNMYDVIRSNVTFNNSLFVYFKAPLKENGNTSGAFSLMAYCNKRVGVWCTLTAVVVPIKIITKNLELLMKIINYKYYIIEYVGYSSVAG